MVLVGQRKRRMWGEPRAAIRPAVIPFDKYNLVRRHRRHVAPTLPRPVRQVIDLADTVRKDLLRRDQIRRVHGRRICKGQR